MNIQPTLEDNLVRIDPLKESDFEKLFATASDPKIWEQHPNKERSEREGFSKFFDDAIASKGAFLVTDKSSGKTVGTTRFVKYPESPDCIEIGWTFYAREFWGGKYNKAIKTLLMDYAFQHVSSVVYIIDKENYRSQKATEKLGGIRTSGPEDVGLNRAPKNDWFYVVQRADWL